MNRFGEVPTHQEVGWLIQNRKHFLEFLRNLTPQILLATIVFRLGMNNHLWQSSNVIQIIVFFTFILALFYAMIANVTIFLESAFQEYEPWRRATFSVLRDRGHRGIALLTLYFWQLLRTRPKDFGAFVLTMSVVQCAVAATFAMAILQTVAQKH